MTRSMTHRNLTLEALEDRSTPASGWFFEDFTSDYSPGQGGFDYIKDGVQISAQRVGARFVPTPAGGPAGRHTLSLAAGNRPEASYLGWTYHTNESGGLAPWEMVAGASVKVRGGGTVRFAGVDEITFNNTAPADQWVTFSVTKDTVGDGGRPLGEVTWIQVATTGQMLVDDVGVQIGSGPLTGEAGEVKVHRFGNGLSVTGSAKSDLVRVEFLYDIDGTVRVLGLAGTRVTARTPDVIQVSDDEVLIPNFAHPKPPPGQLVPERDLYIRLAGGDDWLEVAGADLGTGSPRTQIDDLIIAAGLRDSIVSLDRVELLGSFSFAGGPGQDTVAITGQTYLRGINVRTGAGDDTVQIGQPGAQVFDGSPPEDLVIFGRTEENNMGGVSPSDDGVYTGPGRDTILAAGNLNRFKIDLGAGPDRLRFESAEVDNLTLVPGAGIDVVEFIESKVKYVRVTQDAYDVYRLHRIDVGAVVFAPAGSRVRFELPASGTRLRTGNDQYILTPSDDPAVLFRNVFDVVGLTTELRNRSGVVFAAIDF